MKLMHIAREECMERSIEFGNCIQESGIMSIVKCRDLNAKSKLFLIIIVSFIDIMTVL
jgi:hypothetical protein